MQNEKHKVVITKEDLKHMNYVVCNLSVPLVRDYRKIEKLIRNRINNNISLDEYEQGYKAIINESKNVIQKFHKNFIELYIINLINKKLNNESINLYEKVNFDSVLSGINNSLKINVMPANILNYIANLNTDTLLDIISINVKVSTTNDVSMQNKQYIKLIQNKINNRDEVIQKVYSKN